MSGRGKGRGLHPEEHALWRQVTRSVAPLRGRKAEPEGPAPAAAPAQPAASASAPAPAASTPAKPAAPPLAPLDRRTKQRIARGRRALDARIDLHGLTQDEAYSALLHFLRRARRDGAAVVLVITGKGARASGAAPYAERGVLKRLAPHWLALPAFRAYVLGFETAHAAHGGEGALYVRLRREC